MENARLMDVDYPKPNYFYWQANSKTSYCVSSLEIVLHYHILCWKELNNQTTVIKI